MLVIMSKMFLVFFKVIFFHELSYTSFYGIFFHFKASHPSMNPSDFFRCFMLNSESHIELQTKPFIQFMGEDYFNSVNHVQQDTKHNGYRHLFENCF